MQNPHLSKLIKLVAADNDIPIRPPSRWEWPGESAALEVLAAGLSDAEKDLMAAGEKTAIEVFSRERGCEPLDAFLDEVFDGSYRSRFYED